MLKRMNHWAPTLGCITSANTATTIDSMRWFPQRRSRTLQRKLSCARCVRCDVSSARMALFTFASCDASQQNATFWGLRNQAGAMTPKFELRRNFCTTQLPPSFIFLCLLVRKLSCWQTHPQTHKQTDPGETTNVLRYATTLGKNACSNSSENVCSLNVHGCTAADTARWRGRQWHVKTRRRRRCDRAKDRRNVAVMIVYIFRVIYHYPGGTSKQIAF